MPVVVATTHGLRARHARIVSGIVPGDEVTARTSGTVVIGGAVARELGIDLANGNDAIRVDGESLVVTAIANDGGSNALLATAIVLSPGEAQSLGLLPTTQDVIVNIAPSQAKYLPTEAPLLIAPADKSSVSVSLPPVATALQTNISSDTATLVLIVGISTLVLSLFSIITTMQIAVRERRSEIGILRALGVTRGQIAMKFVVEALVVGVIGAVTGWTAGVLTVAAIVAFNGWAVYLPTVIWFLPVIGVVAGGLGGLLPAFSASRLEPLTLLRD